MSICRIRWPLSSRFRLKNRLMIGLALAIVSSADRTTFGRSGPLQTAPEWTVCIHVKKEAGVPSGILKKASTIAARLLLTAGVPTTWQTSPSFEGAQTPITAPNVHSTARPDDGCLILSVARGAPRNLFPGSLGFALPHVQHGADVTIFYDRIELLEWRPVSANATVPQVLGYAITHEIGHVLLGSTQHARIGIMKGPWGEAEFERLAKGWHGFTVEEGELMRENAFRRTASHKGRSRPNAMTARLIRALPEN